MNRPVAIGGRRHPVGRLVEIEAIGGVGVRFLVHGGG